MKISGIIVEYNPFHNGHKYHIEKTREITNPDVLVAIMSGNYCQRGDLSIMDKFQKTKIALENNIDLVIELPYIYTIQSAYVFGRKAVNLLNEIACEDIVFGSETGNIEELKQYADLEVDVTRLKELMRQGNSYPKAYGLLSSGLLPNDILAISYLKAIKNTNINPICIQRTSSYHDEEISVDTSASAIRKAIKENRDYSKATNIIVDNPIFIDDLYPYIQQLLFTSSRSILQNRFLVDEGIEKVFIENAKKYYKYENFLNACTSRRYTKSRIQRSLLHIANQIDKEDVKKLEDINYIRVLGFNSKGRELLKELNKKNKKIVTNFKEIPEKHREIEWKTSLLYSSLSHKKEKYLKEELGSPIIID